MCSASARMLSRSAVSMATQGMVMGSLMPFLPFRGFTYPNTIILSKVLLKISVCGREGNNVSEKCQYTPRYFLWFVTS